MSATRNNAEGELQILHQETGGYVPATVLLQTEGGLVTSLVPDQAALLSDIQNASAYLQVMENELLDIRQAVLSCGDKLSQSNIQLTALAQIDNALSVIKGAIDGLEGLTATANNLLTAIQSEISQLSGKIPTTLGAKLRSESLSVALATDSTIFASLTNILATLTSGGSNSVVNLLAALSDKIPTTIGAKLNASSLSVALATDSAIFTTLTNLLNALSAGGTNTVYNALVTLSAKIPLSLGAKVRTESLSVALATDSTIFASLTNILNALSDGGTNSALSHLNTIATAQFWRTPLKINTNSPIFNAAASAVSSSVFTLNSQTTALCLQNFFSATGLSAQFAIDFRLTASATALTDRTLYYRGDVASPFVASAGAFPGESPIIVPTHGNAQVVIHLSAITGGNVTTFAKEIR